MGAGGGRHSTEVELALPSQLAQARICQQVNIKPNQKGISFREKFSSKQQTEKFIDVCMEFYCAEEGDSTH